MLRSSLVRRTLATHASEVAPPPAVRHNWARDEVQKVYETPLLDLVFRAAAVHREHFDPTKIQLCTLMNIKSMLCYQFDYALELIDFMNGHECIAGGCTEDCESSSCTSIDVNST